MLLLFPGAAAHGQNHGTIEIVSPGDLDYNDGGSIVIAQNEGDVSKQLSDAYIAKFQLTVVPHKNHEGTLSIDVIQPATPFPFQMQVATNVYGDDPQSACVVEETFEICVPSENSEGTFIGYVYVYGTVTVGSIATGQYTHDITLNASYQHKTGCNPDANC